MGFSPRYLMHQPSPRVIVNVPSAGKVLVQDQPHGHRTNLKA